MNKNTAPRTIPFSLVKGMVMNGIQTGLYHSNIAPSKSGNGNGPQNERNGQRNGEVRTKKQKPLQVRIEWRPLLCKFNKLVKLKIHELSNRAREFQIFTNFKFSSI